MQYRKLDASGDYTLGTGSDFLQDTPETVAQAVRTRLALWAGEWFADTSDGTPWDTEVLGKFTTSTRDAVIKERILGTAGVTSIDEYQSTYDGNTRRLTITATISTAYGTTSVQTTL